MVRITSEEERKLRSIEVDCLAIERHYHLFRWLRGEFQDLLPHEVMICASGDFSTWKFALDVVSELPGVRTSQLVYSHVDAFIQDAYAHWVEGGRQPLHLARADVRKILPQDGSSLRRTLGEMQTLLVHGIHDAREAHESLYIAQRLQPLRDEETKQRHLRFLYLLLPDIDLAFRRVGNLPIAVRRGKWGVSNDGFNLSAREQEILDLICRGETNAHIAAALHISPFTVKNHLQRIFRKIGASNRTQAATKYNQALSELWKLMT